MHGVLGAKVTDLSFINMDSCVILEQTKHVTLDTISMHGENGHKMHHGVYLRFAAQDNLIQNISILTPVQHGLSIQDLSAGNVFRNCHLIHGNLDCHRGLPFDTLRSNIKFSWVDGLAGGALGPFCGRRIVTWNSTIDRPTLEEGQKGPRSRSWLFLNPEQFVMGAIVGTVGNDFVAGSKKPWAMPAGDKGTVVISDGSPVKPHDLYEWQKAK